MPSSKKLEPTNKIYDEAQRQKILSGKNSNFIGLFADGHIIDL